MAFPQTPQSIITEIAPGAILTDDPNTWPFVDITARIRHADRIKIKVGRADEASKTQPSKATLTLDNRDGWASTSNPLGPWYGKLGKNTPLRVGVTRNADPGFEQGLGSWTGSGASLSQSTAEVYADGHSLLVTATGGAAAYGRCELIPVKPGQLLGAVGWLYSPTAWAAGVGIGIRWYDASQTFLSQSVDLAVPPAAAWGYYSHMYEAPAGAAYAAVMVRIDGTPSAGTQLWADEVRLLAIRHCGYVPEWPLRWDQSGKDATATITSNGVLRRLQQGKPPAKSPLRRTIEAAGPWAYWPCEDGSDATRAASALSGQTAMMAMGNVLFSSWDPAQSTGQTARAGSDKLPKLQNGGSLSGVVTPPTPPSEWTIQWAGQLDYVLSNVDVPIIEWATPGPGVYKRWRVIANHTNGNTTVVGYDASGTATTLLTVVGSYYSGNVEYRVDAKQNGANVDVELLLSGFVMASGSLSSVTLNGVAVVTANPDMVAIPTDLVAGHIQVWATAAAPMFDTVSVDASGNAVSVWAAYHREAAHRRIQRLCGEDKVPIVVNAGDEVYATAMFAQQSAAPLDLYQACEDTDGGLLREHGFGLAYDARGYRYNPPVALALDVAAGHLAAPPEPTDDDQRLRNSLKVTRISGSFAIAEDQASIDSNGPYPDEAQIQLLSDDYLDEHARWRLHFGTQTDMRWPSLALDLAKNPDLIAGWLGCRIGSRVTVDHPPATALPDPIDVLAEGYTETLGFYDWDVVLTCSPAQPWQVWTVQGGGNTGRLDTDGSSLVAAATAGATSLSVATVTSAPLWTTNPADVPFDIEIGGERITVTHVSGTSSPQTFTAVRAVNGVSKAHQAAARVSLWRPSVIAL